MARIASLQALPSKGEYINHFNMVRFRITGTGNLQLTMKSLDDVETETLTDFAMSNTTNREPRILTNFKQQRASLKGITTEIDEIFRINRIILYTKAIATEYPG